jgi:uncharacterized protein (TIGR02246 family)
MKMWSPYTRSAGPALSATLLAAILCLGAPAARAQGASDPSDPLHTATRQELDIVKVILAQEAAWNKSDLDGYAKAFKESPDTIFLAGQISRGYTQILADYHHNYPTPAAMGTLGFSELEVHPLTPDLAVCIGKYHLDRGKKEGGPADGVFSLVFEKTSLGWKIVVDHTT